MFQPQVRPVEPPSLYNATSHERETNEDNCKVSAVRPPSRSRVCRRDEEEEEEAAARTTQTHKTEKNTNADVQGISSGLGSEIELF